MGKCGRETVVTPFVSRIRSGGEGHLKTRKGDIRILRRYQPEGIRKVIGVRFEVREGHHSPVIMNEENESRR